MAKEYKLIDLQTKEEFEESVARLRQDIAQAKREMVEKAAKNRQAMKDRMMEQLMNGYFPTLTNKDMADQRRFLKIQEMNRPARMQSRQEYVKNNPPVLLQQKLMDEQCKNKEDK